MRPEWAAEEGHGIAARRVKHLLRGSRQFLGAMVTGIRRVTATRRDHCSESVNVPP